MDRKLGFLAGLLAGVVLIVAVALLLTPSVSEEEAFNKTIEVSGTGLVKVTPDEAHVMVAVVSESLTAQDAAALNARNMTSIFAALKAAGITDAKTRQYSLEPVYKWVEEQTLSGKEQRTVIVGYRATNLIEVVCRPDETGTAIDAAVSGGANRIDSISFQLSEPAQTTAYQEALRKAIASARSKADVVATSMGIATIQPVKISVEDYYYYPTPVPRYAAEAGGADYSTPITPSEVEVTARVHLVYSF